MKRLLSFALALAFLGGGTMVRAAAESSPGSHADPASFGNLSWRLAGPFRGGRALAVTGVPGQPEHFYFGAVDGGVWESENAGRTWTPIFDAQEIASIGSIAVAPSNPKILYVGSGEADMRSDIAYGNGMYRSDDGGHTWRHIGLTDTRQIGAIVVDPHDPNVAYVAALGHQYGPNEQRGVFKTTDGGATWTKVLYKDENTGASALALDPSDPKTIYAALWQTRRPPWNVYPPSNGPGSGIYRSTDGGATWTQLASGLPQKIGRVGLAISPALPTRVYAMVDSDPEHGGLYRSDDRGATWTHAGKDPRIWTRGWYFSGIAVDPKNADVVYAMDTATYRSTDGGKTFDAIRGAPGGDDYHSLWIDPDDPARMILGSDQGVVVSVDGAKTWSSWYNQPTGQFYHVATDDAFPYALYGAQQDSGAAAAPSATKYQTISQQDFRPVDVGGESGDLAPDPLHPGFVFGGTVTVENLATGWEQNVDPTLAYPGTIWRSTWTLPLVFSPADKRTLYFGHQRMFRSRDHGKTWQIVSPDLTRDGIAPPANLDASTIADNTGLNRRGVIYAIAPSPLDARLTWAGTDDGYVWVSRDDAAHWQNVTPPSLTPWSKVGIVEAGHFDAKTAYLAVDRHRLDDLRPYVYRTHDGGATWTLVASGIPDGSFVNVVREDPTRAGLLYAGTERGVYVSFDDGDNWQSLQRNLPVTSVRDIAIHGDDIAIATHGRAFWIMDDVSSLRQIAAMPGSDATQLFVPATAYRTRPGSEEGTPLPLDEPQAQNPPTGVIIDYALQRETSPVAIDVIDAGGKTVRHYSSAAPEKATDPKNVDIAPVWIAAPQVLATSAGAHRFVWDFHVTDADGPLAPPGTYAIRLTAGGRTYERTARVVRDPRIAATDAALREQYALATRIEALEDRVDTESARARALQKNAHLAPADREALENDVIGSPPSADPDDSVGKPSHDFTSFLYLKGALGNLEAAVESADAAPTPDMNAAYGKLDAIFEETLGKMDRLEGAVQ
jgi:photosystem II stability/assembly factor-like uncharacterized protein